MTRLQTVLRVARTLLILSILVYGVALALFAKGVEAPWLYRLGWVAVGWIALSALACLILQLVLLLQWRRSGRAAE
jgi:hypothetical protein